MPVSSPPVPDLGVRAALLHHARLLWGDGTLYDGPLVVTVSLPDDQGEELTIRPTRMCDGLQDPQAALPTTPNELLDLFLSREEIRILATLTSGPSKGKACLARCNASKPGVPKIADSRFWTIWTNLQQRGLIVDAESDRNGHDRGFTIGPEWVREFVRAKLASAPQPVVQPYPEEFQLAPSQPQIEDVL